ncbi:MAG TPA: hypothetical protein VGL77_10040, partial [Armatimonadota bacterium]
MTAKERILRHLAGEPVDRIPMIGGWSLGVHNLAALGGVSVDEYLRDPTHYVVQANRRQGLDGMMSSFVTPTEVDAIRAGSLQEESFAEVAPEALLAAADAIPETAAALLQQRFDRVAVEAEYRALIENSLSTFDDLAMLLTYWGAPSNFSLYFTYGYVAFLTAVALYPDAVGRIYWADGILSRARNEIMVALMREYDLIPLVFTGDDICNNAGPMVQPAFLREYYWPHTQYALEPFL